MNNSSATCSCSANRRAMACTSADGVFARVASGTNLAYSDRQVGLYTGLILKGAKPVDLPVLQATQFEFAINLSAAAFRNALTHLGWSEGNNLRIEIRWGAADPDRIRTLAKSTGANLTNDEKRAHLTDIKREHLIDQVCSQEILPPEK